LGLELKRKAFHRQAPYSRLFRFDKEKCQSFPNTIPLRKIINENTRIIAFTEAEIFISLMYPFREILS